VGLFLTLACTGALLGIATGRIGEVAAPFGVVAKIVLWSAIAVPVSSGPVLLLLPLIAVAALWWAGRNAAGSGASWMRTAADPDADVTIDETTIAKALEALRIQQITAYLGQGLPLQYLTP